MSSDVGLTYLGQTVIITTIDDDDDDVGLHVLGAYYRPKRGPFITLHSLLVEGVGWGVGGGGRGQGEGLICSAYVMVGRPLGKLQVYLHS